MIKSVIYTCDCNYLGFSDIPNPNKKCPECKTPMTHPMMRIIKEKEDGDNPIFKAPYKTICNKCGFTISGFSLLSCPICSNIYASNITNHKK